MARALFATRHSLARSSSFLAEPVEPDHLAAAGRPVRLGVRRARRRAGRWGYRRNRRRHMLVLRRRSLRFGADAASLLAALSPGPFADLLEPQTELHR